MHGVLCMYLLSLEFRWVAAILRLFTLDSVGPAKLYIVLATAYVITDEPTHLSRCLETTLSANAMGTLAILFSLALGVYADSRYVLR